MGYSYDNSNGCAAPNNNPIGQQTGMTDASGSTTWCFDKMGRASSEQRSINIAGLTPGAVTKLITYTYNLDGSVATVGYPSGRTISYGYNSAGRALSAVDQANGINYATGATYAPQGALAGVTYGNTGSFAGIVASNQYNKRLQPSRLQDTVGVGGQAVLDLSYDFALGIANNGTIVKITNNRDDNRSQNFTYDAMNRIRSAWTDGTNWGSDYTVDAWGNLINKTQKTGKTGSEGALNQGADVTNRFLGMSYDASGNLLFDGNNYTYDAENRIKTAAGVTYTYDGTGERVAKSTGTLYWGGSSKDALEESDAAGNLTSEYVFFNGKRCARRVVATGAVFYYFSDHLGSSNVITDAGGNRQAESDFYPYGGEVVILADSTANHYKFTGKERDTETGVDYFFARYYSSALGRFLTPDWSATPAAVPYAKLGDPQTLNLYAYVQNNPITGIDPDGHLGAGVAGHYQFGEFVGSFTTDGLEPGGITAWGHGESDETIGGGKETPASAAPTQQPPAQQLLANGSTIADRAKIYASGFNILDLNSTMSKQSLAIGQSFHGMATGNLKEVAAAAPNTALGLTAGYKNSPDPINKYVGYYGTRVTLALSAAAAVTAGILMVPNNPILRFGRGWKTDPGGTARRVWRFASGGRWGKGGPKLPWHWHWP